MGILEHKIERFLFGSGYGSGSGSGSGDGDGDGYGSGYGSGDGYGDGDGDGSGDGFGDGSGDGSIDGSGFGYGDGSGYGDGDGYGDGYGDGSGLLSINGNKVYNIDSLPTVITNVSGNIAMGFILEHNVYKRSVYIAKHEGFFAHGDTARDAMRDAVTKSIQYKSVDERIAEFIEKYGNKEVIAAKTLSEWHGLLTGSCRAGRDNFCVNHGIDIEKDSFSIKQFIALTIDSYGNEIIKKLKSKLN